MARPFFVPIGGFLGAGKTTLIVSASRLLRARGLRPAAILNDQGAELVDTSFARASGVESAQVTGGCFCCRFSDLIDAAERLRAYAPDVIFAEAVGSCTDIAATVLRPLQQDFASDFRLAPFSVLVDPARAREWIHAPADDGLAYLFRKQIEEADLVCFTRADLHREFPEIAGAPVRYMSPLTGEGVAAWLDEILGGAFEPASRTLDVDYERYARAEAMLAWLNCRASVKPRPAQSPALVIGPLLDSLDAALTAAGLRIAHLKLMDEAASGWLKASVSGNGAEPVVQGALDADPASVHELLLNIRAAGDPAVLRHAVESELAKLPGKVHIRTMQSFSPAPPVPERRIPSAPPHPDPCP